MANYSISQLPTEATAQSTDLIETAIVDANSASGYASRKETLAVVGEAVVSDFQFPLLLTETTAKTITGAINEVAQNAGGNVADEIANLKTSTDATISGGVATFDALDCLPLDALTIGIEYTQSGSGTPSPDNVRTINGFASAVISVTDGDTTETKTISFGSAGTVYKGTLNVLTGELTVTWIYDNASNYTWNSGGSSLPDVYLVTVANMPNKAVGLTNIACDMYDTINVETASEMTDNTIKGNSSTSAIYVKTATGAFADISAFRAHTANFNICYELATPLTYQLTPTEIKSLIGSNTLSADCGDVTICKYTALERIENQVTQYSTSEQKTGKKWIDGKPIYEKTIVIGALTFGSSWVSIAHDIVNLDTVIQTRGRLLGTQDDRQYEFPAYRVGGTYGISLGCDDTYIYYVNNWLAATADASVTLQYTKTSD